MTGGTEAEGWAEDLARAGESIWARKGEPVTVTHGEPLVMPAGMFAAVTTVREAVFQALGTASMCWEKVEGAGVFQSDQAAEIGDQLLATIQRLTGTSPGQVTVSRGRPGPDA